MNENKKKHYPKDRQKLHELLEKKEQELQALQAEVNEIRTRVREADFSAINATAMAYNVTPEQFAEIMQAMQKNRVKAVPDLSTDVKALPDDPEVPEEEDDSIDNEDA